MKQSHSVGRRWLKTMLTLLLVSAPFQWVSAQITLNSGKTQLRTVIQKIKLNRSSCWPGGTKGQYEDQVVRAGRCNLSMGINLKYGYHPMPS